MTKKPLTKRGTPKAKANAKKNLAAAKKRTAKKPDSKAVMSSTPAQKIARIAKNVDVGKLLKQTFSPSNAIQAAKREGASNARNLLAKKKATANKKKK